MKTTARTFVSILDFLGIQPHSEQSAIASAGHSYFLPEAPTIHRFGAMQSRSRLHRAQYIFRARPGYAAIKSLAMSELYCGTSGL